MVTQIKEEEPPSSSSSNPAGDPSNNHRPHGWKYDVFLSFHGEDTRKTFVDHLYYALHHRGIFTFKDDERLERGRSIAPELLQAIELSRPMIEKNILLAEQYLEGTKNIEGILLHPQRERKHIDIAIEAFREMHKLRLLEVHNVWTPRVPDYLPSQLRWLIWEKFPSKSLPPRFEADNLVGLQLYCSSIERPWSGEKDRWILNSGQWITCQENNKRLHSLALTPHNASFFDSSPNFRFASSVLQTFNLKVFRVVFEAMEARQKANDEAMEARVRDLVSSMMANLHTGGGRPREVYLRNTGLHTNRKLSPTHSTCTTLEIDFIIYAGYLIEFLKHIMQHRGIYTFKDDERLERGRSIAPELLKAIEFSRYDYMFNRPMIEKNILLAEQYLAKYVGTKNIEGILLHPQRERKHIDIAIEAFRKMQKLRLLEVHNVWTPRVPEYPPSELRWLIWEEYPSKSLPPRFEADNLVGIQLYRSSIERPWRGGKANLKQIKDRNGSTATE
ncbi:hypothetical protein LguiB_036406 [Lonicera macranthoides]